MSISQTISAQNKLFEKKDEHFLKNLSETFLFECVLFQTIKSNPPQTKIKFMRLYPNFFVLSKVPLKFVHKTYIFLKQFKGFSKIKVVHFNKNFLFSVSYNHAKIKEECKTLIKSFRFVYDHASYEFTSHSQADFMKIYEYFKKKINFMGFHNTFKVTKEIGKGNFAKVYIGYNIFDRKTYAIKFHSKSNLSMKLNELNSIRNEIKILRKINHSSLILLDSVYETKNHYYLVFELFQGGNLKNFIQDNGSINENAAKPLMKTLLEGVKYLHSQNIMHRDIKPDNIVLRTSNIEDSSVLTDFGLATENNVPKYIYPKCGTPGFVAPEIFLVNDIDDHYDLICDLYSVGVTLFFVLTGTLPYPGKDDLYTENKNFIIDLQKNGKFKKLSNEAQDLLKKLICRKEKRINAEIALNHPFFKYSACDDDIPEEDASLLRFQLQDINRRCECSNKINIAFSIFSKNSPSYIEKKMETQKYLSFFNPETSQNSKKSIYRVSDENLRSEDYEDSTNLISHFTTTPKNLADKLTRINKFIK